MTTALPDPFAIAADYFASAGEPLEDRFPTPGALAHALAGDENPPHLQLIDEACADIAAGRLDRLLVTMPPRHGKSRRAVLWLAIWFLMRFPNRRVAIASYSSDLAEDHGQWIRDTISEHGDQLGIRIRPSSHARKRFDLTGHAGGLVAVGTGGTLTGRGANLLIVDDPIGDMRDAVSPRFREDLWNWWTGTALRRLDKPNPAVVLIQTRWHEDDLAGRVLAAAHDRWRVLNLPAIAEKGDILGRAEGEPLWPDRFSLAELFRIRDEETTERVWSALYQQRPAPPEGAVWLREWIATNRRLVGEVPPLTLTVISVDTPGSATGAECGIVAVATGADGDLYVRGDRSLRGSSAAWAAEVVQAAVDFEAGKILIEEVPGVDAQEQVLRTQIGVMARSHLLLRTRPPRIERVRTQGHGKRLRAEPAAQWYEQGRVHHVDEGDGGDHLAVLEDQMTGWTGDGPSPDRLDALVHAVNYLLVPQARVRGSVHVQARWAGASARR